jgi:cytochrome b subunit of formate dehydrogenase
MRRALDRTLDVIWKLLYWLAVLAISLLLVVGLILFLESRDQSSVERSDRTGSVTRLA